MRRTHLRGHDNILKRLLIHSGCFNLGLVPESEGNQTLLAVTDWLAELGAEVGKR
jgi:hypothetical protein